MYDQTRGLRNNNPGNIKHGTDWNGLRADQTDPVFDQFVAPVDGIRAINKILKTYYLQHGLNTVQGIISRWAPGNENDTAAYIADVSQRIGVQSNQIISVQHYAAPLTAAIIHHENGMQPYSMSLIDAGVSRGWA